MEIDLEKPDALVGLGRRLGVHEAQLQDALVAYHLGVDLKVKILFEVALEYAPQRFCATRVAVELAISANENRSLGVHHLRFKRIHVTRQERRKGVQQQQKGEDLLLSAHL